MNRLVETARTIESAIPETSHNKMLPFALARGSLKRDKLFRQCIFQITKIINQCQGTFLHQARRDKVQERWQQETLYVFLEKKSD
jgi:hypothetical protein